MAMALDHNISIKPKEIYEKFDELYPHGLKIKKCDNIFSFKLIAFSVPFILQGFEHEIKINRPIDWEDIDEYPHKEKKYLTCDDLPAQFWVRNKTWGTSVYVSVDIINENAMRLQNTDEPEIVGPNSEKFGSIVKFENSEFEYSEKAFCENWQWSVDRKTNHEFYKYE